jgi:putative ABC transport system permease protein
VRSLDVKLLRDLRRLAPQIVAIAMLAAIGVAVSVMAYGALKAIATAQARFYDQTRFADVFAEVERAPLSLAQRFRRLPGVAAVDVRASAYGLLEVPNLVRPASLRLIALPHAAEAGLNGLVLLKGRLPGPKRADEAVALNGFLDAAHVSLGERLTATVAGRRVSLITVGAVLSPEYVYSPGVMSALPDDAHQAVLWAPPQTVEGAGGLVGAFSQLSIRLAPGAAPRSVTDTVDAALRPYGGLPAYGRADQISHAFLTAELKELRTTAGILPPVFLVVSAVLTHMVMGRLVATEREQIGLLKAFGYTDLEASAGYLKLALVIGLIGAAAGGVLGAVLSAMMTGLYAEYFRFPVFTAEFDFRVFALAGGAAVAAAVAGSSDAVRRVAALSPAAAMHAAPPTVYRRSGAGAFGLTRHLDQPTRMILRRLARFPAKSMLTILGLAASLALLVGTQFLFDALDHVIDHTYYRSQRWSAQVGFFHPRQAHAAVETARLPGVVAAEPVRVALAWASGPNGARKRIAVTGLDPDARLARPLDRGGRPIPFRGEGAILSEALAARLGVRPGGVIELEFLEGRRARLAAPVVALASDFSGLNAFLPRATLNRMLGEGDLASGADLLTVPDSAATFYRHIETIPQIVAAGSRDDTVGVWRRTMARTFVISMVFYLGFAGAIAFGVAYNTGRITLAERSRDLATLQVLGFTRPECAYILFGEMGLLGLLATPAGLLLGRGFAHTLAALYSREEVRLPVLITAHTLGVSLAAYAAAITLAALLLVRRLWRLDMVAVLKSRE